MRLRALAVALLAAAAVSARQANTPNTLSPAEREAGWTLLFDGKTLTGWRAYDPARDIATGWSVEDGSLKNSKSTGRPASAGGDIVTVNRFGGDFEFRFDWRVAPGGNSGVKYFVMERLGASGAPMYDGDDGRSAIGHEYQILDDERHSDAANGPDRHAGALYALVPPGPAKKLQPVGQFNESRVVVRGQRVEHWLNGAKIVDYTLPSAELAKAIANSKFRNVPKFGTRFPTRLLLQDHGDEVWFRNLKIRDLHRNGANDGARNSGTSHLGTPEPRNPGA